MRANGGEKFGLFYGVNSEICFEIQFKVEHFTRITCFFADGFKDKIGDLGIVKINIFYS